MSDLKSFGLQEKALVTKMMTKKRLQQVAARGKMCRSTGITSVQWTPEGASHEGPIANCAQVNGRHEGASNAKSSQDGLVQCYTLAYHALQLAEELSHMVSHVMFSCDLCSSIIETTCVMHKMPHFHEACSLIFCHQMTSFIARQS